MKKEIKFIRKTLLTAILCVASMFASAQVVFFEDDFEWLEPWSQAGDRHGHVPEQIVETDDNNAWVIRLEDPQVDGVTAYEALLAKGYDFLTVHADGSFERKPYEQIYLLRNYLKFGLTNYQSGIVLPALTENITNAKLSFDWCSHRSSLGTWDATKLVVIIGDNVVEVPEYFREDNSAYSWVRTTIELGDLQAGARIAIRNCNEQWDISNTRRWYLDNIEITTTRTSAIENLEVENKAVTEYFNLLGSRVNNAPLTPGLYIRRQGATASKILVK